MQTGTGTRQWTLRCIFRGLGKETSQSALTSKARVRQTEMTMGRGTLLTWFVKMGANSSRLRMYATMDMYLFAKNRSDAPLHLIVQKHATSRSKVTIDSYRNSTRTASARWTWHRNENERPAAAVTQ